MTVLLDTGVLFAAAEPKDTASEAARSWLRQAISGRWGRLVTADWVVAELFALLRARRCGARIEQAAWDLLEGLHLVVYPMGNTPVADIRRIYEEHPRLSLTDAALVHCMHDPGFDHLATFDQRLARLVPCLP